MCSSWQAPLILRQGPTPKETLKREKRLWEKNGRVVTPRLQRPGPDGSADGACAGRPLWEQSFVRRPHFILTATLRMHMTLPTGHGGLPEVTQEPAEEKDDRGQSQTRAHFSLRPQLREENV